MSFTKKKESFTCDNCGHETKGTGYTNHCPKCLWSCHVDVDPGDRQSECHGKMKPIDIYFKQPNWIIIHECQKCRYQSKNRIMPEDDFDEVIRQENEINDKKVRRG